MYIGSNICYNSASFDPSICQSEVRLFKKTTIQALTKEKQTNKQIKQKPTLVFPAVSVFRIFYQYGLRTMVSLFACLLSAE